MFRIEEHVKKAMLMKHLMDGWEYADLVDNIESYYYAVINDKKAEAEKLDNYLETYLNRRLSDFSEYIKQTD
jgi:hypothetical protein